MNQTPTDHDRQVERVLAVLRDTARHRRSITYRELTDCLGGLVEDLAGLLRQVSTLEDDAGRRLLTALVVQDTGRPGRGWFRLARDRGRVGSDDAIWRAEVDAIYATHDGR